MHRHQTNRATDIVRTFRGTTWTFWACGHPLWRPHDIPRPQPCRRYSFGRAVQNSSWASWCWVLCALAPRVSSPRPPGRGSGMCNSAVAGPCLESSTCGLLAVWAWPCGGGGGGGAKWVRFASPQLAPTAPATTGFVALGSMCQLMLLLSACPSVQWAGSGARTLPAFSTVPGQLSPVGLWLWGCKCSARLMPLRLVDQHAGPFLYGVRGGVGQGCIGRGGGYPPPLQGAQPMPSHRLPDGKRQLQWHL